MKKLLVLIAILLMIPIAFADTNEDLWNSLVAYYKFDESSGETEAVDTRFADNMNEVSGVTADFEAGLLNNGFGSNNNPSSKPYINGTLPRVPTGTDDRTLCYWTYLDDVNTDHWAFLMGTTANQQGWAMRFEGAGVIRTSCRSADEVSADGKWATDKWNFVCYALSHVGERQILWTNETLVHNGSQPACNTPNNNFGFGSTLDNGGSDIILDNAMLFNRTLGTAEVSYLYNSGAGIVLTDPATGGDTTAPTINWTVPSNNTRTNADPVLFTLNVTDNIGDDFYCELRNTSTLIDSGNFTKNVYDSFSYDVPSNWESESILYNITCNDNSSNNVSLYLNVTIDTLNPVLNIVSPTATSINKLTSNLTVTVGGTDKTLYILNYTIWNSSGIVDSMQNMTYATGGAGQILNLTNITYDIGDWSNGNYKINATVSDPHTFGSLRNLTYDYSNDGVINFFKGDAPLKKLGVEFGYYQGGTAYKITSTQITNFDIDYFVVEQDKEYKFGMVFDMPNADFRMAYRIPKEELVLYESDNAHFIWKSEYYVDFDASVCNYAGGGWEGRSNCRSGNPTWYENGEYYYIYYDYDLRNWYNAGDRLVFYTESIGGLNIVEQSVAFTITNTTILSTPRSNYTSLVDSRSFYYCHQESANISNWCGYDTGQYNITNEVIMSDNSLYLIDGNYSTGASGLFNNNITIYINYTTPLAVNKTENIASFAIGTSGTNASLYTNMTIPESCVHNKVEMKYDYYVNGIGTAIYSAYCYDMEAGDYHRFSAWTDSSRATFYEESIYWAIPSVISTCGSLTNLSTLNISFYNLDDTLTSVNYSSTFDYTIGDYTNNLSYTEDNINSVQFCIFPEQASTYADLNVEYLTFGTVSNYFTNGTSLNNATTYINLYADSGSSVTATVYDGTLHVLENAYIQVQRYDVGTNTYKSVGTFRTNAEGKAVMYLQLNTAYYRFLIYYPNGKLQKTTNPTYIYSTDIVFQINLQERILQSFYQSFDTDYELEFNNATDNFRFIYSDTTGNVNQGCLRVYRTRARDTTLINETCLSAGSGTILGGVSRINDTTYVAKAFLTISGTEEYVDSASVSFFGTEVLGTMALLITFLLTIVFAFVMFIDMPIGIILTPIPTLMMSGIGLLQLDINLAVGIEIAAIVIAYMVSQR